MTGNKLFSLCISVDGSPQVEGSSISPETQTLYSDYQPSSMADVNYNITDMDGGRVTTPQPTVKGPIIYRR